MSVPMIAPLVGTSLQLALELMRMARELKQLEQKDWDEFKRIIDKEFEEVNFPDYDELRKGR